MAALFFWMKPSAFWDRGSGNSQRNLATRPPKPCLGKAVINRDRQGIEAIDIIANWSNHAILWSNVYKT